MSFARVLVVGAGQMGAGIAQVVAASGREVSLHDASRARSSAGSRRCGGASRSCTRRAGRTRTRCSGASSAVDELAEADLLIEAIVEDADAKKELFRAADEALPAHADPRLEHVVDPDHRARRGDVAARAVIGMHFFNPVPVLALVEVIRAEQTSDETAAAIVALARDLGKTPAEANDFPGFVSNRILMPFVNEAAYALMEGVAEAEAIDTVAKLGFAHPMGPLALADLIGLDTCVAIMDVLHEGLGDPKYAPCPLLRRYVAAGRLGRKSGRGFYEYD